MLYKLIKRIHCFGTIMKYNFMIKFSFRLRIFIQIWEAIAHRVTSVIRNKSKIARLEVHLLLLNT